MRASQVALVVKNPHANAGDIRDADLIPGLGRFPGGGHGRPLQYSCLKNPIDRGLASYHRVAESKTAEWLNNSNNNNIAIQALMIPSATCPLPEHFSNYPPFLSSSFHAQKSLLTWTFENMTQNNHGSQVEFQPEHNVSHLQCSLCLGSLQIVCGINFADQCSW